MGKSEIDFKKIWEWSLY